MCLHLQHPAGKNIALMNAGYRAKKAVFSHIMEGGRTESCPPLQCGWRTDDGDFYLQTG